MVLESIVSAAQIEKKPSKIFLASFIITTFAIWIAYVIFPSSASIVFIFLITVALSPVIYKVLQDEEIIDERIGDRINLRFYEYHKDVIMIYSFLFLGVLVATSFWFSILPAGYLDVMFSQQISTTEALGAFQLNAGFWIILLNNLKVTTLAFIVSFFFGTGAIFILSWNASVIAVFVGKIARHLAVSIDSPLANFYGYLYALPTGLLSIALHGIPEIVAYFFAGIAGGILSAGVIRAKRDDIILKDALALFFMSVVILVIAAFIEVYITPFM